MEKQIGKKFRRCKYGLGEIQECTAIAVSYSLFTKDSVNTEPMLDDVDSFSAKTFPYYRPKTLIKGKNHWYNLDEIVFLND